VPDAILPTRTVEVELAAFTNAWWKCKSLAETKQSLSQVVLDYQFQICAYIMRRLHDPRTPDEVKDAFALKGAPNLGVVLRHPDTTGSVSIGYGTSPTPPGEGVAPGPNVQSVLDAYRVTGKPH